MRRVLPFLALAAACGGTALPDRVAVVGVDRLSGELSGQEVELPGTDLAAVRGPAGMMMLGPSAESARIPDCALRRSCNNCARKNLARARSKLAARGG